MVPDLIILHLGTNDSSYTRGDEKKNAEFLEAYDAFLETIHKKAPQAKILCILGVMDQRLCSTVSEAVRKFKENHREADVSYLELPLQSEEDGIGTFCHPTYATNRKVAKLVSERVREMTGWI